MDYFIGSSSVFVWQHHFCVLGGCADKHITPDLRKGHYCPGR
jgi:hypothetical protein